MKIDVEEFYKTYGPMVYRRCLSILRDEDLAVDAMQECFVKILKNQDRLDPRAPSSLLYTTATNLCLNMIRDRKRRRELLWNEGIEEYAKWNGEEAQVLTKHFLERLFQEVEDSTRTMAYLHYVDGFTLEETAEQTGFSVSGVRKRLRGLKAKGLVRKEA